MIRTILCVLIAETWNTAGQLLFKKSADTLPSVSGTDLRTYRIFFKNVLCRPGIFLGLTCHAVGLVFWLAALSRGALSVVFVFGSMQYILVLIASRIFLGEKIDGMRFLGTLLIAIGITLVALANLA
ncbi:MAG: EamA family transporter [Candidatus Omnitrophota bacterium]